MTIHAGLMEEHFQNQVSLLKIPSFILIFLHLPILIQHFNLLPFADILPNGEEMKILPVGIQHSVKTKSILGNGVIIDAKHLLHDLNALQDNGINV